MAGRKTVEEDVVNADSGARHERRPMGGRRFLVTGGAQGIGAAIVARLAELGARGAVIDRQPPRSHPVWPTYTADVTDETQTARAVAEAEASDGPFDGLIACAGVVPAWHTPTDIDLEVLDTTMAVNVRGFVCVLKHAAPHMAAGSTVVAVGSINSWRGDPHLLAYVASKHAVLGAVRSAALALGPQGIRVNAVGPGPVPTDALVGRMRDRQDRTGMSAEKALEAARAQTALRRLATTDDVADAVVFLSSPASAAITGHLLPVDGGLL